MDTELTLQTPTLKYLDFHKCYGNLQCAKLELPLDYWNGTNLNKTISLAIAKVPAKVPVTDPRYGGPILVNPGGPGGSGVQFVAVAGTQIQTLVDSPEHPDSYLAENSTAKYYDILGFDPRGIGNTSPVAMCFDAGPASWSWMLREITEGILGSSDAALGRLWSMNQALGDTCNRTTEGDDIKQFITTASVARDMVELIERHGEWKESEARRLISQEAAARNRKTGLCQLPGLPQHLTYKPGEEKLQYWGFSYGTFLGSTFASTYPSRVSRLILDGVVDADDYIQTLWTDNLDDTEKVVQTLYATCARAGPTLCPLAHPSSTPADIESRVADLLASLYHNPLPVPGPTPEVISYSDVKLLIFSSLYGPIATFPTLARLLAALARRDGSALRPLLAPIHSYSCPRGNASRDISDMLQQQVAQWSIICADGAEQSFLTPASFDTYWRALDAKSPSTGAIWARIRMRCAGWRVRALHRFAGPFKGQTAHPVLWVGNTADPVTPVGSAWKMAARFPGSVVLEQDSAGVSSSFLACLLLLSAPFPFSSCAHLPPPPFPSTLDDATLTHPQTALLHLRPLPLHHRRHPRLPAHRRPPRTRDRLPAQRRALRPAAARSARSCFRRRHARAAGARGATASVGRGAVGVWRD